MQSPALSRLATPSCSGYPTPLKSGVPSTTPQVPRKLGSPDQCKTSGINDTKVMNGVRARAGRRPSKSQDLTTWPADFCAQPQSDNHANIQPLLLRSARGASRGPFAEGSCTGGQVRPHWARFLSLGCIGQAKRSQQRCRPENNKPFPMCTAAKNASNF